MLRSIDNFLARRASIYLADGPLNFFGGGGFILEMVVLREDVGLSKIRLTHDNEVVDDGCDG